MFIKWEGLAPVAAGCEPEKLCKPLFDTNSNNPLQYSKNRYPILARHWPGIGDTIVKRETLTDNVALRLSEKWAVLFDDNQWIIAEARKRRTKRDYRPRWYIGSNKTTLHRVLREKGIEAPPSALSTMEQWPERFLEWLESDFVAGVI